MLTTEADIIVYTDRNTQLFTELQIHILLCEEYIIYCDIRRNTIDNAYLLSIDVDCEQKKMKGTSFHSQTETAHLKAPHDSPPPSPITNTINNVYLLSIDVDCEQKKMKGPSFHSQTETAHLKAPHDSPPPSPITNTINNVYLLSIDVDCEQKKMKGTSFHSQTETAHLKAPHDSPPPSLQFQITALLHSDTASPSLHTHQLWSAPDPQHCTDQSQPDPLLSLQMYLS